MLRILPGWCLGASLRSLTLQSRLAVVPPWPDLVIGAGKRAAPVARFIKNSSEGHTRIVHIGRPRARLADFDLVITTPQYGLPALPNLIEIPLPLSNADAATVEETAYWQGMWKDLPRPWIVVAIGAAKFPLLFSAKTCKLLAMQLEAMAGCLGGTLIVIGSPRTDAQTIMTLQVCLSRPFRIYGWRKGEHNPYRAALTLADQLVVTSDSASMMSEALSTGKPVHVFELPVSRWFISWSASSGIASYLVRNGLLQPPRNVSLISQRLLREGHANVVGDFHANSKPAINYRDVVLARISELLHRAR